MCILYVLIMYLNYVLSCCTYHNLYNGENEVGPDFRHVLYFIIHCKRLKINVDFRGKRTMVPDPPSVLSVRFHKC